MTEQQLIQNGYIYGAVARSYLAAGWPCVMPVPPGPKHPPPPGYTGDGGNDTTAADVAAWCLNMPGHAVALRMPAGIIGIDVDQYVKGGVQKNGALALAELEAKWGPLPATWTSTARGSQQPSRIHFFRAPDQRYAGKAGPDIEIIQRHHRYAVVWPSPHGETGGTYRWYDPWGIPSENTVPRPHDLAELPPAWVQGLAGGASPAGPAPAAREDGWALIGQLAAKAGTAPCISVMRALESARAACAAADRGSRHDAMTEHVYEVVNLGAEGHAGAADTLAVLQDLWGELIAGEDREDEFTNPGSGMLISGARKAVARHGTGDRWDPCLMMNAAVYAAPAPEIAGAGPDEIPAPVQPPQMWSPFQVLGVNQLFDPRHGLDSTLAADVLARTQPLLRYAPDAGAWVVRGPQHWDIRRGDMAKWAVDLVSWLMPAGDPDSPDGSEAKNQATRRARFTSNGPASAIAGKMTAQVMAGHHRSTVELSELDGEREILWAGAVPYDLRRSGNGPWIAEIDPGTPHLHSAGVVPAHGPLAEMPTPLWDAFLAAVWPDPEMRRWALCVLSVAFTGYADKALPILSGETDAGKTQVVMLLASVLGSYAHAADARLLAPADRSHASIVFALRGRRLSFIDEAPRSGQQAAERLKQITGGSDLTGNRMAENPITFSPTHTLILTANPEHEPALTDAAIRRRVRLIPCAGDVAAVRAARAAIGAVDGPAWRREAPGVLAKMMALAAEWLAEPGLASNENAPAGSVIEADSLASSQNPVLSWLEECEPWEAGTRSRDLYKAFTESCRQMAIHQSAIWSETRWGRMLTTLGFPHEHRRDGRYRPLRVKPPSIYPQLPANLSGPVSAAPSRGGDGSTHHASPENQTRHDTRHNGESPGQTNRANGLVMGVTSSSPLTHTYTHTHTHTQENGNGPSQPSPRHSTPAPHGPAQPPAGPVQGSLPGFEPDLAETAQPSQPVTKTRAKPKAPKPEKVRPDPVLEGPVHPLPVLIVRNADGSPPVVIPCSPQDARAACEPYLGALCVDVEHSGFPVSHADYALRTVQLGGEAMAADLDPSDPAQAEVIRDLLDRATALHAHSACADLVPLAWAGLADADALWAKMTDSVLIAKLADPALAGSDENELKKLAGDLLGGYAVSPAAEKAKNALFKSGGWLVQTRALTPREKSGWAMVKPGCETMARYAGSDVLDLAGVLRVLPQPDSYILNERERPFQAMCARVAHTGFALDHDHIGAKITEISEQRDEVRERVHAACPAIENPSSTTEVPAALAALGVPLGTTPGGNPSASKTALELLAKDKTYEHSGLLGDILEYRHCVTTLGLLLEPLNVLCERGDGRMRPVVYTINADTGRTSCVRPNGQQFCFDSATDILTDKGWLPFPAVTGGERVAQWSPDGTIDFVTPLNVIHEAYDGPMVRIAGEHHEQVVTPNHRVYSKTRRGDLRIEEAAAWLRHGARDKIVDRKVIRAGRHRGRRLSPDELLALRRAVAVQADGALRDDCRFIGLLFTKKRKAERARELGLEVRLTPSLAAGKQVYQAKAYAADCAPWLSLPGKTFDIPALLELDAADLQVFLDEIMFWDGDFTRGAAYNQSVTRAAAVDAVELAAILCGYSTCRSVKQVAGRSYACVQVHPKADRFASRTDVTQVPSDGAVHCVEVPSGAVVVRHGGKVIISGNSRQGGIRACVTADPGYAGISADFKGVEIRVGAALSGDMDLLAAEMSTRCLACGQDPCAQSCGKNQTGLHWMAARMAFGPDATKEDRYNSKRIIFSRMFGGGPKSGAAQVGLPLEAGIAVHRAFEALAPGFADWDRRMRAYVEAGNRGFTAYSGRVIWLPRGRAHAAGNYAIQGSARELLVDGVLRWRQTPWGHLPLLPIHDEILTWVPAAEALAAREALKACMRGELYGVPIEAAADEPFTSWPDSS